MTKLWGRRWATVVNDGKEERTWGYDGKLPGLDIEFKVSKTPDVKANEAEITLIGLNADSRNYIQRRNLQIVLNAGYAESQGLIFKGNTELTDHQYDNVIWNSKVYAKDGGAALRDIIIFKTYAKGTLTTAVIESLIKKLTSLPNGLAPELQEINKLTREKVDLVGFKPAKAKPKGQRQTQQQKIDTPIAQQQATYLAKKADAREKAEDLKLKRALLLRGAAVEKLQRLCRSAGLECIITDQKLSVFPKGLALLDNAIVLDRYSGLIGSPEKLEETSSKVGQYKIRSLLRHEFNPGLLIEISSRYVNGVFLVNRLEHSGNSRASDWYTDLFCTEYTE